MPVSDAIKDEEQLDIAQDEDGHDEVRAIKTKTAQNFNQRCERDGLTVDP
jgi:hypothetical protein